MPKFIDHTGEKRMMNCGLEAEIIRYGKYGDIDVQFSDGEVVTHRTYGRFIKGQIAPPKKTHLGEKRMMKCGLEATIIRYGGCKDIDVQFEDGRVVYKREYYNFKRGAIAPPVERVGEKRTMNCGLEATIIRYGSAIDIDVLFENGQVVYHKQYGSFIKGKISPPIDPRKIDRIGEKRMMKCGLEATIIRYGGCNDIDVQFEDGQAVYQRTYVEFKRGSISPPIDPRKIDRTGEKRMMKCGLEATIIRYGGCNDIDVQFEDGQVVYHKHYKEFKRGSISPPIDPRKIDRTGRKIDRTGEKRMMNCGLEATIIRYGGAIDIDVLFENGQVVYHKQYFDFQRGAIAPPVERVGEKRMMNCGLEATIIRYGGAIDIDIQFEDGQVVYHKPYDSFIKGTIAHPGFKAYRIKTSKYKSFITKYTGRHPQTKEPYYHCKCQKCGFEIIDTARNIIKLEHKCETQSTEEGEN